MNERGKADFGNLFEAVNRAVEEVKDTTATSGRSYGTYKATDAEVDRHEGEAHAEKDAKHCTVCGKPVSKIDTGQLVHTGDYDSDKDHAATVSEASDGPGPEPLNSEEYDAKVNSDFEQSIERLDYQMTSAVTQYDIRRSKKSNYNRYALAQYLARVEEITADIRRGGDPRMAILAGFTGALADTVLKSIGQPKAEQGEANQALAYKPVTERDMTDAELAKVRAKLTKELHDDMPSKRKKGKCGDDCGDDCDCQEDAAKVTEAEKFHTIQKMVSAGNPQRMHQRMHIKRFKSSDEMHGFLNKQTNNDWKESKHDLKSGKYVYAGGEWQNVKGIDPSALSHM